eukprot:gene755-biopygen775
MRYADDHFEPNFIATIGVDFKLKIVDVDDAKVKLQIWDTAGQERFCNITRSYYRGSDGILIVYDVTNRDSFSHVTKWIRELDENTEERAVRVLVGNKADLVDKRVVAQEDGRMLAEEHGMPFFETSALTGDKVDAAFEETCAQCMQAYREKGGPKAPTPAVRLALPAEKKKKTCCI